MLLQKFREFLPFLIVSSAFQIALQALNIGNGFQNHIQLADVFFALDSWYQFLQSSIRISGSLFSCHVSVLLQQSSSSSLVCGGWRHRVGGGFNTHVLVIGIEDVLKQKDERNTRGPYLSASHSGMSSSTILRRARQSRINSWLVGGGQSSDRRPVSLPEWRQWVRYQKRDISFFVSDPFICRDQALCMLCVTKLCQHHNTFTCQNQ